MRVPLCLRSLLSSTTVKLSMTQNSASISTWLLLHPFEYIVLSSCLSQWLHTNISTLLFYAIWVHSSNVPICFTTQHYNSPLQQGWLYLCLSITWLTDVKVLSSQLMYHTSMCKSPLQQGWRHCPPICLLYYIYSWTLHD